MQKLTHAFYEDYMTIGVDRYRTHVIELPIWGDPPGTWNQHTAGRYLKGVRKETVKERIDWHDGIHKRCLYHSMTTKGMLPLIAAICVMDYSMNLDTAGSIDDNLWLLFPENP